MKRNDLYKRVGCLGLSLALALTLSACGNSAPSEEAPASQQTADSASTDLVWETIPADEIPAETEETVIEETEPEENHDGQYRSELTNEWLDESIQNQRPIAVMVDNELYALDHYGLNQADIIYEMMNSTANGRITRLMCLVKDYAKLTQFGSVRSVRPTNFMIAAEYNAILCHDGGPFYINDYVGKYYTNNLNGGFARFSNGKAVEFTEYITYDTYTNPTTGKTYDGLKQRLESSRYSIDYNDNYEGPHFTFSDEKLDLSSYDNVKDATYVDLPFPHNSSELNYDADTDTYGYYEYGDAHIDPLDDNNILRFTNLIVYSCDFHQYDENGYMVYNVVSSGEGYYITGGKAIPITWSKSGEAAQTVFKVKATGEEIVMNTGKTYIAIVPSDKWSELGIQ